MSSDPETFARHVATVLFTCTTTGSSGPADYAQPVLDAADGAEADMLASDVRGYLPSPTAWAQLRQYRTRQLLTIDTALVPEAWETAQAQAAPGQLPVGATAYTITEPGEEDTINGQTDPPFNVFFDPESQATAVAQQGQTAESGTQTGNVVGLNNDA